MASQELLKELPNNRFFKVRLRHLFIAGFIVSGGIQCFLVLLKLNFDESNYGFTRLNLFDNFPGRIDTVLLFFNLIMWAGSYSLMYIGFRKGLGDESLIYRQAIRFTSRDNSPSFLPTVANRILVGSIIFFGLLVVVEALRLIHFSSYLTDALNNYVYDLRGYVLFTLLLSRSLLKPTDKVRLALSALTLLFIVYIAILLVTGGQRAFLMIFCFVVAYFYLIYGSKQISVRRITIVLLLFVVVFFLATLTKFSLAKGLFDLSAMSDYIEETVENTSTGYVGFTADEFLKRLNSSSVGYWYLVDMSNGDYSTFADTRFSFYSLLNMFIPGAVIDLSDFRKINGIDLEQWMFWRWSGGSNEQGGQFLPPFVEAVWVTRSYLAGGAIVVFLYWIIGIVFRIFLRKGIFVLPIIITLFIPMVFSPESSRALFYTVFRAGFIAAFLQLYYWGKDKDPALTEDIGAVLTPENKGLKAVIDR